MKIAKQLSEKRKLNMSSYVTTIICFLMIFIFSGCMSPSMFKKPDIGASYGPAPVNYKETIKEYFEETLFDSYSAQYKFGKLDKAYTNEGAAWGGDVSWLGYAIDVKVNAKNRFGGYVGYKKYLFLLNGEHIYKVNPFVTENTFHRAP
jgi:hypothetical protein